MDEDNGWLRVRRVAPLPTFDLEEVQTRYGGAG
jgi:hypothetical protein